MLRIVKISFCELEEFLISKGILCEYCERGKGKKEGKNTFFWVSGLSYVKQFHMLTDWQKLGVGKYA